MATPAKRKGKTDSLRPKAFRKNVWPLLSSTLAIGVLSMALPVMTLQVYDRILPNEGTGTLPVLVTGVCIAVLLEAVLRLCRAYLIGRAGASYEHLTACRAIEKILNANLLKIGPYGIGEHMHRMASVGKLRDFYNGYSLTVLTELAFVPLYLGLIFYIAHALAFIPAFILAVFCMISLWNGYKIRESLKNREAADDARFNFLIESLQGVHTIKSFALEKFFERRYEKMEEDSTLANYAVTRETAGTFNTGAIFSHLMVACVISAGAWLVLHGLLTTGALVATLLLSGRMMQPIQKALSLWARYQDYLLARGHIEALLSTPQRKNMKRKKAASAPDGNLVLSRVCFEYGKETGTLLKDISLKIRRGDSILITGAHGEGKTTLLNLIAGIYPPSGGSIKIDGCDINAYPPEELVRHIGFIRAQPLIFRGTIRDNITCFGQTNEVQAREVAALLGVDKDIARLPGGLDTFLSGNDTDSIPPGLRQRIAIVRVLASKPRLILFDNADRALDKAGYAMIYSLLARLKGKASMILITDDRNIRALADRHYELKDGRLLEGENPRSTGNIRPYKELRL